MKLSILELCSANLPIGSFSYSDGLESFVDMNLITSENDLYNYLENALLHMLAYQDLPLLRNLYQSWNSPNTLLFEKYVDMTLALRNTKELRLEEKNKGKALTKLFAVFGFILSETEKEVIEKTYLGALAVLAFKKELSLQELLESYCFIFIEGQCIAAQKLLPIGQSSAWRIINSLCENIVTKAIDISITIDDENIGSSLIMQNIMSATHEDIYSRLFRS